MSQSQTPISDTELPHPLNSAADSAPMRRIKMAADLFDFAFQVKHFQLKTRNPDKSERELYLMTMKLLESACAKWWYERVRRVFNKNRGAPWSCTTRLYDRGLSCINDLWWATADARYWSGLVIKISIRSNVYSCITKPPILCAAVRNCDPRDSAQGSI